MKYLWIIGVVAVLVALTLGELACSVAFLVMMLALMAYELTRAHVLADDDVYFDWSGKEESDGCNDKD